MLVLTRRVGEEIVIAGNIRVMVVAVKGRINRLGITAPSAVPVVRRELLAEGPEGARSRGDEDAKPLPQKPSQSSQ
jgi:carbon storage regulator